jgi:CHAD domain-containing protein
MAEKGNRAAILDFCAKSIHPNLESLTSCAQKIIKRKDIEDIHDLRVASRRIRTCLTVFFSYLPKKKVESWQREIRSITKLFGQVRDLDVQIDLLDQLSEKIPDPSILPGLKRIRLRLNQKREKRQGGINDLCQSVLKSDILSEMKTWVESVMSVSENTNIYSLDLFQLGYENIQSRLDNFLFYEVFLFDPSRIEELHQMRIAAKRLRYTLEVFSNIYDSKVDDALEITRKSQQYLGNIHDCDVWINFLPKFLETEHDRILSFYGYLRPFNRIKPGLIYLLENRKKERDIIYQSFLEQWKVWKFNETWLDLRKIIFMASLENQPSTSDQVSENSTPDIP